MRARFSTVALLVVALSATPARAHVGSPDVVYEGQAGPYSLLVSVRPPQVIPGVAEIEVLARDADVQAIDLQPLPLAGPGATLAPAPDHAAPVAGAQGDYTGRLWLMAAGSWQVRVTAKGARGEARLSVPVPALPSTTRGMPASLAMLLAALGLLLGAGAASLLSAAATEATLPPGELPDPPRRRRRLRLTLIVAGALAIVVWGGGKWWDAEASDYARYVYKPLVLEPRLDGNALALTLRDPGWLRGRRVDDWVPDHDHLMHLFVVRLPALDRVYHLHPDETGPGSFRVTLPAMEAGRYRLYADVVHATGLPETPVGDIELPAIAGAPTGADDAWASVPAIGAAGARESTLAGGGKMVLADELAPAGKVGRVKVRVVDGDGQPTRALGLYMGMLGHAAVVAQDGTVFAHVHPTGSVPMGSIAVASGDAHAMHHMGTEGELPSEVAFPYTFPKAGRYRLFVQVKRAGKIETGAFDVDVK